MALVYSSRARRRAREWVSRERVSGRRRDGREERVEVREDRRESREEEEVVKGSE